jgi:hypothetical protein
MAASRAAFFLDCFFLREGGDALAFPFTVPLLLDGVRFLLDEGGGETEVEPKTTGARRGRVERRRLVGGGGLGVLLRAISSPVGQGTVVQTRNEREVVRSERERGVEAEKPKLTFETPKQEEAFPLEGEGQ